MRDPTVLLVEDDGDVRESIVDVLHAGLGRAHILAVPSGEEGLKILASQPVDLVMSDYMLPGMDGLVVLREAHRLAPQAPRILITAFTELEVAEEALHAARIEAVVTKPLDAAMLVARVQSALDAPTGRIVRDA